MYERSSPTSDETQRSHHTHENLPPPILSINNLTISLQTNSGPVKAVDDVTLSVNAGETLGLVGESGCGKSILCKSIIGLLPHIATISPESHISYDKQNLSRLNERQFCSLRGNAIAMVFQDPMTSLNPVMKVGNQIIETLIHNKITKKHAAKKEE